MPFLYCKISLSRCSSSTDRPDNGKLAIDEGGPGQSRGISANRVKNCPVPNTCCIKVYNQTKKISIESACRCMEACWYDY